MIMVNVRPNKVVKRFSAYRAPMLLLGHESVVKLLANSIVPENIPVRVATLAHIKETH